MTGAVIKTTGHFSTFAVLVEIFESEAIENNVSWIYFKSGNRVNKILVGTLLKEIKNDEDLLDIKQENVLNNKQNTVSNNPVVSLIEKQLDKNSTNLKVEFNIPTIKNDVYNLIKTSFPDEKIDSLLTEVILQKIDIKTLKKDIKKNINFYYNIALKNISNVKDNNENSIITIQDDQVEEI